MELSRIVPMSVAVRRSKSGKARARIEHNQHIQDEHGRFLAPELRPLDSARRELSRSRLHFRLSGAHNLPSLARPIGAGLSFHLVLFEDRSPPTGYPMPENRKRA